MANDLKKLDEVKAGFKRLQVLEKRFRVKKQERKSKKVNILQQFDNFEKTIKRLRVLENELEKLPTKGFEVDVSRIKSKIKNVSSVDSVERDLNLLKKKIAENKNFEKRVKIKSAIVPHSFSKDIEKHIADEIKKKAVKVCSLREKKFSAEKKLWERAQNIKLKNLENALKDKYSKEMVALVAKKEEQLINIFSKKLRDVESAYRDREKLLEEKYLMLMRERFDRKASKELDSVLKLSNGHRLNGNGVRLESLADMITRKIRGETQKQVLNKIKALEDKASLEWRHRKHELKNRRV